MLLLFSSSLLNFHLYSMELYHRRSHKRSLHRLRSWAISVVIFFFIVIFAQSPPHDQLKAQVPSAIQHGSMQIEGDELVKCLLTTPHAKRTATYQPADGTIEIHVHQQLAPNAANAFLNLVSSKHFDGNYIFRVVPGFIVQWGI